MAGAVIGALRVVLGADSAALDKGLKDAQSSLSAFGSNVAKAGAAIGAALGTAAVVFGVSIKRAIDEADKLGKSAQKWGVPVEELSRLKHAADLSGISFEGLGTATSRLSRNMSEVAGGAVNTASRAFEALGISVKKSDGSLKSSTEVMEEVSGKFAGMKDGAGKTAIAMALFGKSGAELIPMLNAGRDGLREMMQEADQLGIVIDSKTAKAAENFNDNLTRLARVKDGIVMKITAEMLPAFEHLSQVMINFAKDQDFVKNAATGILSVINRLAFEAASTSLFFQRLGAEAVALWEVLKAPSFEKMSAAWRNYSLEAFKSEEAFDRLKSSFQQFWAGVGTAAEAGGKKIAQSNAPIIKSADDGAKAIDGFLASQMKTIAARAAELTAIGLQAGARERLTLVMQTEAIAAEKGIQLSEKQTIKMSEAASAAENLALRIKGAQLVQSNAAPHEKYRQELANNEAAMIRFGATTEQITAMQTRLAEQYGVTWHQQGDSIAGSIKDIGTAFAGESKKMAIVAKAAGLAQAIISMWVGAARALELPFPLNIAAWAKVLAIGAGAVSSIRGVNVGGMATGGSFRVPGGVGGGDRVRAMVDLEPGEQVDVWRPGHGSDPRRGGAPSQPRAINIALQGEFWSEGSIRRLVEKINESLSDGTRLRVA